MDTWRRWADGAISGHRDPAPRIELVSTVMGVTEEKPKESANQNETVAAESPGGGGAETVIVDPPPSEPQSLTAWSLDEEIAPVRFRRREVIRTLAAAMGSAALGAVRCMTATATADKPSHPGGVVNTPTVIPFSATEIPNPGRGMYDWDGVINFPIGSYSTWPISPNYYHRPVWSAIDVGTTGPSYDWTSIDNLIEAAAANGQRFSLSVMTINPWAANGVPEWLWGTTAVTAYSYSGSTWYVPNYNDPNYLTAACNFITALGARYDKDERLAWFEVSLYGDWSEGHCYQTCTDLGIPYPSAADSISVLGYWAESYQLITLASVTQLVNAHLAAFPNTQLISPGGGPCYAMHKALYTASTIKPVGTRWDGLTDPITFYGTPAPLWALDPDSYYVSIDDPFLATAMNRWQTAPIPTEQGGYNTYASAIPIVCNYPISLVASQNVGGTTDDFATAIKYSGYRYAVSAVSIPSSVALNSSLPITATWNNYGVAPTYDQWQITYQLRNSSNVVVASTNSSFNLKTLFNPAQGSTVVGQGAVVPYSAPLGASANDTASISTAGLSAGSYTVAVVVTWNEHKAGATYTWNYPPMNLALQDGPNSDGSYPIGTVTVASKAGAGPSSSRSFGRTPLGPSGMMDSMPWSPDGTASSRRPPRSASEAGSIVTAGEAVGSWTVRTDSEGGSLTVPWA